MHLFTKIKDKVKNSYLLQAILINVILLIVLLVLFEPAEKIDDYRMKFILAGGALGEPSAHLLYSNIFLGSILEQLTKIIPLIPWYEVTQYILLFLSFTTVTYMILCKGMKASGYGIFTVLLFVFGFETYIKLTFSKTAGIAVASGLIFLMNTIKNKKIKQCQKRWHILISLFLIVMGTLLRYKVFMLAFGVCLFVEIFDFLCEFIDLVKIQKRIDVKDQNIKVLFYKYFKHGIFLIIIFVAMFGMKTVGRVVFRQSQGWKEYQEYNALKAELQDFGWPDYDQHTDMYQELGISRNDYEMWVNRDYSDPYLYTTDMMETVIDYKMKDEEENFSEKRILFGFFDTYPGAFLDENTFWVFLFMIACICFFRPRYYKLLLALLFSMIFCIFFYFYFVGRYEQHHLDLVVWYTLSLILISYMRFDKEHNCGRLVLSFAAVFIVWWSSDNWDYMKSNTYYGANLEIAREDAKEFLELASGDEDKLYITNNAENWYVYSPYSTFEQIPSGIYHNIYCLADYMFPTHRVTLENFGVYNVYDQIAVRDDIYYFYSRSSGINRLETMLAYIKENYTPQAFYRCIKDVNGIKVYQLYDGLIDLDSSKIIDNIEGIYAEYTQASLNDGVLKVSGHLYKENTNSFEQRVYVEMKDRETGNVIYETAIQLENEQISDLMNGRFDGFDVQINLSEEWDISDTYNMILEYDDVMYRIPIKIL